MSGMKKEREFALRMSSELTSKFGFISRNVVWKHLSAPGQSSRYRIWRFLTSRPEFAPYRSGIESSKHLVFSNENRRAIGDGGAVSQRPALYFEHDEYLMEFILYLKRAGVVSDYWTEQELKMDRLLSIQILGGDSDSKKPDLIFDLKTDRGPVRVALEIERTIKSSRRYRLIQMAYYRLRKINLLLFGVPSQHGEAVIRREFDRNAFSVENRAIGYFTLPEFSRLGLETELRVREKHSPIGRFFMNLCGSTWSNQAVKVRKMRENTGNSFPHALGEEKGAA